MNRLQILLLMLAFAAGAKVMDWYHGYADGKQLTKEVAVVHVANTKTETHSLAAATHIGAVHAGTAAVGTKIEGTVLAPTVTGDHHAPALAAAPCPGLLPSVLADPQFRVLYDAGADPARGQGEASHVPDPGPGHAQRPHR